MSFPEPFAAVRKLLLDESSVTSLLLPQTALPNLASAPIFAYEYPRKIEGAAQTGYTGHDWAALLNTRSIELLLISPSGRVTSGADASYAPWSRVRFDTLAYGRTFGTASAVHWAVYEYLKSLSRVRAVLSSGTALVHDVTVEAGPISFTDDDTECPVVVGTYAATVAEEHVA